DAFIDFERREVRAPKGERIELSETEVAILSFLAENHRRAVSRAELLTRLWGFGASGNETRTIDMHITRLRAKLREAVGDSAGEAIVTVRARGYMAGPALVPETDQAEGLA